MYSEDEMLAQAIETISRRYKDDPRGQVFEFGAMLVDDRHRARILEALRKSNSNAIREIA